MIDKERNDAIFDVMLQFSNRYENVIENFFAKVVDKILSKE